MSPLALALVLVAAVLHATWNVAARRTRVDGGLFVFCYAVGSAAIWLPAAGVWLLFDPTPPSWSWLWAPAVSGLLHAVYGTVLQRGYRHGDLSLVYPVARGVGPLVTLVIAVTALRERPAGLALLGAIVIVSGIGVISFPGAGARREHAVVAGVGWGVATGLSIATYTLWDNHSVNVLDVPPLPYFAISLVFQVMALAPRAWHLRAGLGEVWQGEWRQVLTVSLLSPLAYVLVLQAMLLAPVALVASTRETSIVLGVLLGRVLFGEPGGARRTLGSVVVLVGIGLVALG